MTAPLLRLHMSINGKSGVTPVLFDFVFRQVKIGVGECRSSDGIRTPLDQANLKPAPAVKASYVSKKGPVHHSSTDSTAWRERRFELTRHRDSNATVLMYFMSLHPEEAGKA